MKPNTKHLKYLDGWRGMAIALVFEGHFLGALPLESGRLGVDIFFCLSGFLMSGLLFIQRQPLPAFYKRRISRILPAFLLFVSAIYSFEYLRGKSFSGEEVISTLLFLRTYLPLHPGIWGGEVPIGHIWSLNVEEHGYVLMSAFVLLSGVLLRRRINLRELEGPVLMLAGTVCIGIGIVYVRLGARAPHWGALGSEVAASTLLLSAGYRLLCERRWITVPRFAPILAFIIAVLCYYDGAPWWAQNLFPPFLLAFAVNHLSQTYLTVRTLLANPGLRWLGIWSYSLYLWQQPFYTYKSSVPGGAAGALCGAVGAALMSFYVLERPCRKWLNANW